MTVALTAGEWSVEPVSVAVTASERLVGIHAPDTISVMLRTRSVHGKALDAPLRVVHLTRSGVVVGFSELAVGGIVRAAGDWMLELPIGAALPALGDRVRVLPSSPR